MAATIIFIFIEHAAQMDPGCPFTWLALGLVGGGLVSAPRWFLALTHSDSLDLTVLGCDPEACFERSAYFELQHRRFSQPHLVQTEERENERFNPCQCARDSRAWACLAAKGHFYGFTSLCSRGGYIRLHGTNWLFDGTVPREYSIAQCVEQALKRGWVSAVDAVGVSSREHSMWCLLGCMTDRQRGVCSFQQICSRSAAQCFQQALVHDPEDALAWLCLGHEGGGTVGDEDVASTGCYVKARRASGDLGGLCTRVGRRNPFGRIALNFARASRECVMLAMRDLERQRVAIASDREAALETLEEIEDLSPELKTRDELMGAKIQRTVDGVAYQCEVEDIEISTTTGKRLYLIRYSDGDAEHLLAEQVKEYQTEARSVGSVQTGGGVGSEPSASSGARC